MQGEEPTRVIPAGCKGQEEGTGGGGKLIFYPNFGLNLLQNLKITVPPPWEEAHDTVLGREILNVDFERGLFNLLLYTPFTCYSLLHSCPPNMILRRKKG